MRRNIQSTVWGYDVAWKPLFYHSIDDPGYQKVLTDENPDIWGRFYLHGLTSIPAWISYQTLSKLQDGITYPFLNFSGCTIKV